MKHKAPTLKQKLKIYKRVKKYLPLNCLYTRCICLAITHAQRDFKYLIGNGRERWSTDSTGRNYGNLNVMEFNFPELYKRKPKSKSVGEAWWSLSKEKANPMRIQVVDEIIAELEAQL